MKIWAIFVSLFLFCMCEAAFAELGKEDDCYGKDGAFCERYYEERHVIVEKKGNEGSYAYFLEKRGQREVLKLARINNEGIIQYEVYPQVTRTDQSEAKSDVRLLPLKDEGFTLVVLDNMGKTAEQYTFCWKGRYIDRNAILPVLTEAEINGMAFKLYGGGYTVTDGESNVIWKTQGPISLSKFCVELMPKNTEEIKKRNQLLARLGDASYFPDKKEIELQSQSKIDIYLAPMEETETRSVECQNVKNVHLVGYTMDNNWALIEYEEFDSVKELGYISRELLVEKYAQNLSEKRIPVTVEVETSLTNTPYGEEHNILTIPKGSCIEAFGWIDPFWIYVEMVRENERIRGCIPLDSISYFERVYDEGIRNLSGCWEFVSGAEVIGNCIVFEENGCCFFKDDIEGVYCFSVFTNQLQELYLEIVSDDYDVMRYRLRFNEAYTQIRVDYMYSGGKYRKVE